MRSYRKSYRGFVILLILFILAVTAVSVLAGENEKIEMALVFNICSLWILLLTAVVYLNEKVYWYSGISFEMAAAAGSARRKAYARKHLIRFGIFTGVFLLYSIVSFLTGIPSGIDIAVFIIGELGTAFSTMDIRL